MSAASCGGSSAELPSFVARFVGQTWGPNCSPPWDAKGGLPVCLRTGREWRGLIAGSRSRASTAAVIAFLARQPKLVVFRFQWREELSVVYTGDDLIDVIDEGFVEQLNTLWQDLEFEILSEGCCVGLVAFGHVRIRVYDRSFAGLADAVGVAQHVMHGERDKHFVPPQRSVAFYEKNKQCKLDSLPPAGPRALRAEANDLARVMHRAGWTLFSPQGAAVKGVCAACQKSGLVVAQPLCGHCLHPACSIENSANLQNGGPCAACLAQKLNEPGAMVVSGSLGSLGPLAQMLAPIMQLGVR